jgi:hypothetical protein
MDVREAARQAIALLEHQGMTPSPRALADIELLARGEITEAQFLARSDARVAEIVRRGRSG